NGIECNYYQPTADTTDARMTSIDQAVKEGAGVIVVPGFLFGEAMLTAPDQYPDVKFIASDVNPATDMGGATPAKNLYCLCFAEEQCGFLAGYAAVKDGYKDVGFLGGMAVPAVVRFGQGYVQGISAAAEELGVDVNVKYMYGGQFFGDANITAKMEGWYQNGTELVFACGGGIWTSPAEAAVKNKGMIIGVDTDQHHLGENKETYAYNPFITSAVKALSASTEYALDLAYSGKFDTIGGTFDILGLQQGDFVGLATADTSWGFKNYTVADNDKVIADIKSGKIEIDNNCDAAIHVKTGAHTTVTYIE
ncbi:MAG: BMP family ABC transporter substrate-binding protein, partial [Pseudoflavonifractor sp.]